MSYSRPNPLQQLNTALIRGGQVPQATLSHNPLRVAQNVSPTPVNANHLPIHKLWWQR